MSMSAKSNPQVKTVLLYFSTIVRGTAYLKCLKSCKKTRKKNKLINFIYEQMVPCQIGCE